MSTHPCAYYLAAIQKAQQLILTIVSTLCGVFEDLLAAPSTLSPTGNPPVLSLYLPYDKCTLFVLSLYLPPGLIGSKSFFHIGISIFNLP